MSEYIIAISKKTKDTSSNDPNDFIFHSGYNTFKIIKTGVKIIDLDASTNDQEATQVHGLSFTPLVAGFCRVFGSEQTYPPNCEGILVASSKTIITNGVKFNYIEADATNIIFNFDNTNDSVKRVFVRYYCLETI